MLFFNTLYMECIKFALKKEVAGGSSDPSDPFLPTPLRQGPDLGGGRHLRRPSLRITRAPNTKTVSCETSMIPSA